MKFKFLLPFLAVLILVSCGETRTDVISFEAMDTFMTIRSFGKNANQVNQLAKQRVEEIEQLLSTTRQESALYQINSRTNNTVKIEPELNQLLHFAIDGAKKSKGRFNPALYPVTKAWGFTTKNYTVPEDSSITQLLQLTDFTQISFSEDSISMPQGMMLDFGAIGKGYAGDQIINLLKNQGIKSALLDLGGNIQALGTKVDGSDWIIGLKNPWGGNVPVALKIQDCAVITSGGYERFFTGDDGKQYIHIFDGTTGKPVNNKMVSATIVSSTGLYGDYLSTTTFILGKDEAINFWRKYKDFGFIFMMEDKSLCYSADLKDKISILGDFSSVEIIE